MWDITPHQYQKALKIVRDYVAQLEVSVSNSPTQNVLWTLIGEIGWGEKSTNYKKLGKWLAKKYPNEVYKLDLFISNKREKLAKVLSRWEKDSDVSLGVGDDSFWDLTAHIVGLGKAKYDEVMANPAIAKGIADRNSYKENFQYVITKAKEALDPKQKV